MNSTFEYESSLIEKLTTVLSRCIIPIFGMSKRKPHLCGSGFLLSSNEGSFIVSAAHVLREGRELFFYIKPSITRNLTGTLRLTQSLEGKHANSDRINVGVLKLEGPGLPPYPDVGKFPLSINKLRACALPRERKQYLLVGFPETQSRANPVGREVTSTVYAFRNVSISKEQYSQLGVAPESHIAIRFSRKKVLGGDGKNRAFPKPSGMSGSPVWLLHDEVRPSSQVPVVGIAIEHMKDHRAIVATDIGFALKLIDDAF